MQNEYSYSADAGDRAVWYGSLFLELEWKTNIAVKLLQPVQYICHETTPYQNTGQWRNT